ncbi:helix-turn-helix transcriptional regulator [Parachitinimonas caeni]|uniref:Transcriptional regulator n=1 Tax=Parachitinimonas caeni TaxID=3031301 RepID=A0ABT7DX43_9NEIS|nr:metalloregulator ArsR/SmtB family transcription factor [Parachitinimonas caeni]MDK2124559.1 transcriptional regulator [Parachitinimonas caeni]
MATSDRILYLLKTRGPQTAQALAEWLDLTSMGARRQLESLQEKGLLQTEDRRDGVGRPSRYWSLSDAGHARFPDRHADLTLQLIGHVRQLFGEEGLDRLIAERERQMELLYTARADACDSLAEKVSALAEARTAEGYMAEVQASDDGWLLVENHCPICAAARQCQGFCRSELAVFRRSLGEECQVERVEHVISEGQRCAYRIIPLRKVD